MSLMICNDTSKMQCAPTPPICNIRRGLNSCWETDDLIVFTDLWTGEWGGTWRVGIISLNGKDRLSPHYGAPYKDWGLPACGIHSSAVFLGTLNWTTSVWPCNLYTRSTIPACIEDYLWLRDDGDGYDMALLRASATHTHTTMSNSNILLDRSTSFQQQWHRANESQCTKDTGVLAL
eukprot:3076633-Amphidinium_carterae.1